MPAMERPFSLAYLTSNTLTPPEAIRLAAELGYAYVGLRLLPNMAGAPQQYMIGLPDVLRETLTATKETGVGVFDLEIIRLTDDFALGRCLPLIGIGAELGAKALLVAGDDTDPGRLAANYAHLCEVAHQHGMTADLEFMPWTAVPDAKAALRVVDAAGRPAGAGILADALHFARSDTTADDLRALPRELLHYAQICDAPTGLTLTVEEMIHAARCERLLPGEGGIDLRGMFAALPADLPVSVEVPHMLRMAEVGQVDWARQALAAARQVIDPRP